jgi:hypothetical protein
MYCCTLVHAWPILGDRRMILKVFMLIIATTGYGDGGLSITSVEFSNLEDCMEIKEDVVKFSKYIRAVGCYER